MSVQAITCALAQRGVSASEKLLLLVLANYANEHMQCWPSQKKMAADTSLTERTVRALLVALETRRLLSRVEHWRDDGSRGTDRLTLHFSGEVVTGTEEQPEIISAPPEATSGGTGNRCRGVPEAISALTTFEPPLRTTSEANASSVAPATGKRPVRRVPDGWEPHPDKTISALLAEGFTAGDLERALTRMRDHEFAKPHSDWDAVFRNWVRRDADQNPRKANGIRPHHNDAAQRSEDRMRRIFGGAEIAAGTRRHDFGG